MKKEGNLSILKEAWKDPKYKALIKLAIWFLFFLILIIFVRCYQDTQVESVKPKKTITKTSKIEAMDNFEYEMTIDQDQNSIHIKGIKYSDINDFEVLNTKEKYTIKNDIIYQKESNIEASNLFLFQMSNLFPEHLKEVLTKENMISEIRYQNEEEKKEYQIPSWNILPNNPTQKIIVYEDKNYITKIEVDFSQAINTIHSTIQTYRVTIEYQNINQIENYQTS